MTAFTFPFDDIPDQTVPIPLHRKNPVEYTFTITPPEKRMLESLKGWLPNTDRNGRVEIQDDQQNFIITYFPGNDKDWSPVDIKLTGRFAPDGEGPAQVETSFTLIPVPELPPQTHLVTPPPPQKKSRASAYQVINEHFVTAPYTPFNQVEGLTQTREVTIVGLNVTFDSNDTHRLVVHGRSHIIGVTKRFQLVNNHVRSGFYIGVVH